VKVTALAAATRQKYAFFGAGGRGQSASAPIVPTNTRGVKSW